MDAQHDPAKFKLVPREPTEEMMDEGGDVIIPSNYLKSYDGPCGWNKAKEIYKRMIVAAPETEGG